MNRPHGVIIVGGGVAGMAAADLLSGYGLRVLVVDDNAHNGGQLLRTSPFAAGVKGGFEPDRIKSRSWRLMQR